MIEQARGNDIEHILSVINRSNRQTYSTIIPAEQFKDPVLSKQALEQDLKRMTFYVERKEGEVVGVAALEAEHESSGRVHWVYVLPQHCRKGIGTALISHLEQIAIAIGLRKLTLYTAEKATWAVNFYENLGYRSVDRIIRPWGFDLLMEKDLSVL